MRPMMKRAAILLLGGVTLGVSGSRAKHHVVVAQQQRAGLVVMRIFTGPDGRSHAEERVMKRHEEQASP